MRFGWLALAAFLCASQAAAAADASPKVHVVYSGQRLISIAKRYGVTLEALRNANGLAPNDKIQPGQKLLIPIPGDRDGSRTRSASVEEKVDSRAYSLPEAERVHRVEPGQRLESIAKRYGVTVPALCSANEIKRWDKLRAGQRLIIPDMDLKKDDAQVAPLKSEPKTSDHDARKRGYLDLYTYTARFRGRVLDTKGHLITSAGAGISRLLGATGDRPRIDPRLIALLVKVSEHFGNRPIRVVSGYRTNSYYEDSRHKHSRAVDFSIPGVDNSVLRDYLRTLERVGVGYYPNSSFVHMDVRDTATYWVDYAGPGEAPRHRPGTALASEAGSVPSDSEADADAEAEPRDPPAQAITPDSESDSEDSAASKPSSRASEMTGAGSKTKTP